QDPALRADSSRLRGTSLPVERQWGGQLRQYGDRRERLDEAGGRKLQRLIDLQRRKAVHHERRGRNGGRGGFSGVRVAWEDSAERPQPFDAGRGERRPVYSDLYPA